MGMNHAYGQPDDEESIATLQKALELGINFWDTADIYAHGDNERLVSKVLKPNRKEIFIATKFGFQLDDPELYSSVDGSPEYVKKAVEASLKRLQTDVIDLYYAHRIDPDVPVEETVGAMGELVAEGKVRYIGLSEVGPETIRRAHAEHPISAVQSEYSLLTRGVEESVLPLCKELNISFVPFSPLARGLMTNELDVTKLDDDDFRTTLPRYQQQHAENNHSLADGFAAIARKKECSPAQLALAWVLAQGEHIIPIPGTKKRKHLIDNAGAVDVEVTENDEEKIEQLLAQYPDTGDRYSEETQKLVDGS